MSDTVKRALETNESRHWRRSQIKPVKPRREETDMGFISERHQRDL